MQRVYARQYVAMVTRNCIMTMINLTLTKLFYTYTYRNLGFEQMKQNRKPGAHALQASHTDVWGADTASHILNFSTR
jgi:hypothetical protein